MKSIQLPYTVSFIEENTFEEMNQLEFIKCKFGYLKYFNREQLKTIVIKNVLESGDVSVPVWS